MKNILIVDDNLENRLLLEKVVESKGYNAITAVNGNVALEKLKSNDFSLIISDILMPVMDGFQLLKNIKKNPEFNHIPFVFYTATYTSNKDKELGMKLGVDKYIEKPIEPEGFIKIIETIISDYESGSLKSKKRQIENEEVLLELYNKQIVQKLEEKVLELEEEITRRNKTEIALRESEKKLVIRGNYLSALNQAKKILLSIQSEQAFQDFVDILGPVTNASRTYIFMNHINEEGITLMSKKAEFCSEGITSQINNTQLQNLKYESSFSRWFDILSKGNLIFGNIKEFPTDEMNFLKTHDIKSILIIPIILKKEFIGFVGFDNCINKQQWDTAEQDFLKIAANDLACYIERRRINS